jgi:16S rRNA (uracil1498-N3)-methyltransferase
LPRFYVDIELIVGNTYNLPDDVVRHINVLRLRASENIELFNGDGHSYLAKFITLEKRLVTVEILSKQLLETESPVKIILLMALIANDKFDLVVQKAVELGVNEIVPIITQNTQRNFSNDKVSKKLEHWQKIIISASEQSFRNVLMEISEPVDFKDAVKNVSKITHKYILSPHHDNESTINDRVCSSEVVLCVGPEGGFVSEEVSFAVDNGVTTLLLGKRIMRAETAAISGISMLQIKYGDF